MSPLLANVFLDELDRWIAQETRYKDVVWIRYADDAVAVSRRPVTKLRQRIAGQLEQLGLSAHPEKTREVNMGQYGGTVDFLGYRLAMRRSKQSSGRALLWYPTPKAEKAIRAKIRAMTPLRRGGSVNLLCQQVNQVVRGWVAYFKHSNRRDPFRRLWDFEARRIRRMLIRRVRRRGAGVRRYPDQWLRNKLGLVSPYHIYGARLRRLRQPGEEGNRKAR